MSSLKLPSSTPDGLETIAMFSPSSLVSPTALDAPVDPVSGAGLHAVKKNDSTSSSDKIAMFLFFIFIPLL